jgi:hypothetical protein
MNKKMNTFLFILVATVGNLLILGILITVSLVLIAVLLGDSRPGLSQALFVVAFIGSLVGSFFIYGFVMKKLQAKYNLDQYLHPIFKKKQ